MIKYNQQRHKACINRRAIGVIVAAKKYFAVHKHILCEMSKILVVDDDRDILTVVKILLTMNHFAVKTVYKWEYINSEIDEFSPDLILLDVALGGADGRDICRELKKSGGTQHIPIILFSAHYDLVNNTKGCLADGVVTKPFETSSLIDTINKSLAHKN